MEKKVLITLREFDQNKIKQAVEIIEGLDVRVTETLPFGVIVGTLDESKIPVVRSHSIVEGVDEDGEVRAL